MKIKWKISVKPKGAFASFTYRGWPMGYYPSGVIAVMLHSQTSYSKGTAEDGHHKPIEVIICDHSTTPDTKTKLKTTFTNLTDAKAEAIRQIEANPHFVPKQLPVLP